MDGAGGAIRVLSSDGPAPALEHDVDERWLRAFAVAVGDTRPALFDVDRPGGIVAHPLFPVCLEWPLIRNGPPGLREAGRAARGGLHAAHRVRLHAPLRPGGRVRTECRLGAVEPGRRSVRVTVEFRTYSDGGALVATTHLVSSYPDTRLDGPPIAGQPIAAGADGADDTAGAGPITTVGSFAVDETNAVVYSECSRIWNPIHTDARAARAAGLPGTILHGTEVLARAISTITGSGLVRDGAAVTNVGCRFSGPVRPGMTLDVVAAAGDGRGPIRFRVVGPDGPVITHGHLAAGDGAGP